MVTLQGILQEGEFFGPPNFGENPTSDKIEQVYYLQLPTHVNAELILINNLKLTDIEEWRLLSSIVQVFSLEKKVSFKDKIGKKVKVTGSLTESISGHHHTPVIMQATSAEVIESWKW